MSVVEGTRQRPKHPDHVLNVHRTAHSVGQRPSFDQLEDQVRHAAVLSEVEDVEDVRVLEPGY